MKKHIILPLSLALFLFFTVISFSGTGGDYLFIDKGDTEELELDADTYQGYEWIVSGNSDQTIVKYEGKEFEYGSKNTELLRIASLERGVAALILDSLLLGDEAGCSMRVILLKEINRLYRE